MQMITVCLFYLIFTLSPHLKNSHRVILLHVLFLLSPYCGDKGQPYDNAKKQSTDLLKLKPSQSVASFCRCIWHCKSKIQTL